MQTQMCNWLFLSGEHSVIATLASLSFFEEGAWGGGEGKPVFFFFKWNIIFAITVETWLDRTQQVAKELNLGKAAVLSAQSKLSAEI